MRWSFRHTHYSVGGEKYTGLDIAKKICKFEGTVIEII